MLDAGGRRRVHRLGHASLGEPFSDRPSASARRTKSPLTAEVDGCFAACRLVDLHGLRPARWILPAPVLGRSWRALRRPQPKGARPTGALLPAARRRQRAVEHPEGRLGRIDVVRPHIERQEEEDRRSSPMKCGARQATGRWLADKPQSRRLLGVVSRGTGACSVHRQTPPGTTACSAWPGSMRRSLARVHPTLEKTAAATAPSPLRWLCHPRVQ